MGEVSAKEIQLLLLEMFKDFHQLCVQHNLVYYALGGTALGARRHGGFIPWDDDIDVGMPREDYRRFLDLPDRELPCNLAILSRGARQATQPYPVTKLCHKGTTVIERNQSYQRNVTMGVYIDIFPLDGTACRSLTNLIRHVSVWLRADLADRHYTRRLRVGPIVARLLQWAVSWKIDPKVFAELLVSSRSFSSSRLVANFHGAWGVREVMPKRVFGAPTLRRFENIEIYTPEHIDEYLRLLYGDFMTPPPFEKRVSHHNFVFVDLNKGFLETREGDLI